MPRTPTFGGLVVIALGVVVAFVVISLVFKIRYLAELEPPAQYNHPYNGQVVEHVMPVAEVRTLCISMGADVLGVACSWQSDNTCYIVLPNDEQAPVSTYRRHEIAHCNGWPANHPRDG
jgi:hypothetical protein